MSTKPKVLVLGGGSIGERHARCFLKTDECTVSMCDMDPAKREKLTGLYPLQHTFAEFEKIPLGNFDVVVVATPAPFHIPQSLAAARAGCHVLCEKPLSNKEDGIQELIDTLTAKKRVGATAFTMRSVPAFCRMKRLIDDGVIGTPKFAVASVSQNFPHVRPDYRQIYFAKKAMGGGTLFDMCPHLVNLMEWFLGPESEISCMNGRLAIEGIETDDTAILNLRHRDGGLSQVNCVMLAYHRRHDFIIHGTQGSIVYDYVACQLSLQTDPTSTRAPVIEAFPAERDDFYIQQAKFFLSASRGAGPVPCTLEQGWQTLRAIFAAQRSMETGSSQKV